MKPGGILLWKIINLGQSYRGQPWTQKLQLSLDAVSVGQWKDILTVATLDGNLCSCKSILGNLLLVNSIVSKPPKALDQSCVWSRRHWLVYPCLHMCDANTENIISILLQKQRGMKSLLKSEAEGNEITAQILKQQHGVCVCSPL